MIIKLISSLIATSIMISTALYAEEESWPYACLTEISWLTDKRYFDISSMDDFPVITTDSESIEIDRKSKTIKVWTIYFLSPQGRQNQTPRVSKLGKAKIDTVNDIIKKHPELSYMYMDILEDINKAFESQYGLKPGEPYIDYSNFGYIKALYTINYQSRKFHIGYTGDYNCNGSTLSSLNPSSHWDEIQPSSIVEIIMKKIMKKYNLK